MNASIYILDGTLIIERTNIKYSSYFEDVSYSIDDKGILTVYGQKINYQFFTPTFSSFSCNEYFCDETILFHQVDPEYLETTKKIIKPKWWQFYKKEEEITYTKIKAGWVKMLTEPELQTWTTNNFIIKD